jgi:hypothetical protein
LFFIGAERIDGCDGAIASGRLDDFDERLADFLITN